MPSSPSSLYATMGYNGSHLRFLGKQYFELKMFIYSKCLSFVSSSRRWKARMSCNWLWNRNVWLYLDAGNHRVNYGIYIKRELKDRASQKGFHKALWNIFMFPFTAVLNFINYRKWIHLLNILGIEENELGKRIAISIIKEKVSVLNTFKKYGETQPNLGMNEGYIIEKDALIIFPLHKPKTPHHFYTEIQEPLIISFSKSKHPFQTLWKTPTLTKIENIELSADWTTIMLKGELFDNNIELRINKEITAAKTV